MTSYKSIEGVLQFINKKYVSLDTAQVKHNNERLRATLWDLIGILKSQDVLFDKLFTEPYFGGSYYDDLKVGEPDEFDLDLLLVLPKACEAHKNKNCGCVKVTPSNKPGFFWFQVQKGFCAGLDKFIIDGYIQTNLVLDWLKSNIVIALNKLTVRGTSLDNFSVNLPKYYSESGPALTLQLYGSFGKMDVDLVPAFKFGPEYWPKEGFRLNPTQKTEFFIVPKKPKELNYGERYWRASFQDQEREIIKGKERLKPALRLLKKMRNNLVQTKISSYALKTLVLWKIDTSYFNWNESLGDTFIKLLEKYKECLSYRKIPYYWNRNNNLLDGINYVTLLNHHNEISTLIKKIKDQYTIDPCVVAKVILKEGTAEYREFLAEYKQQTDPGPGLSVRTSSQGSSYYTFDPNSTARENGQLRNSDATQQTTESSSIGWAIGGVALGIGAITAIGLGVLGAINNNNNNRRQNR